MSDIKKLESEGININIKGEIRNFKGSLLFCVCDTLAAALLGGFKESAYRLCRICMVINEEWENKFREDDFVLRNKTDHNFHIETVTDLTITKAARQFWQKMYGVNTKNPLLYSTCYVIVLMYLLYHSIMMPHYIMFATRCYAYFN